MKKSLVFLLSVGLFATAFAEENNWRLTVGPVMRTGVKSSLNYKSGFVRSLLSGARGPAAVKTDADNGIYDDGFFIGTDNSSDPYSTWNWQSTNPSAAIQDDTTIKFTSEYLEEFDEGLRNIEVSDRENIYGGAFELSRTLWQNDRFGIDIALGVNWFQNLTLFKTTGMFGSVENGTYHATAQTASDGFFGQYHFTAADRAAAILGAGTATGPGLLLDAASYSGPIKTVTGETALWLNSKGKISMIETQLTAQPFVRVCDQFYLRGKIGMSLIYTDVSISGSIYDDKGNTLFAGEESDRELLVAGVIGLSGAFFLYNQIYLQGGVEYLLFNPEMKIDTAVVDGDIKPGNFGLYLGLGIAF